MKRDLELIRHILTCIEESPNADVEFKELKYGNYTGVSNLVLSHHIALLLNAGLIEAYSYGVVNCPTTFYSDIRMTMAGHDYLDAIRNDTIWNKTKSKLADSLVSATFETIKKVAIRTLTSSLGL